MGNHKTHSCNHGHDHHHGHHHSVGNIKVAFFLNLGFTILEIIGGFFTNSMAILSDAVHDLGDSLALGLSWYLQKVSNKDRDEKFSYGYSRFSLLGAVINSSILLIGSFFILMETIPRIMNPEPVHTQGMLLLSIVGIGVNLAAVLRLKKGTSLNERSVMLHLLEDVFGWVAILISSIVMMFWDVPILDPILSLGISAWILFNAYKGLRKSFTILLQAIPDRQDVKKVETLLSKLPQVSGVHDIHMWTLDGEYNILTVHISVNKNLKLTETEPLKKQIRQELKDNDIEHVTIEIENDGEDCELINC